jgi:hypothetical protein
VFDLGSLGVGKEVWELIVTVHYCYLQSCAT